MAAELEVWTENFMGRDPFAKLQSSELSYFAVRALFFSASSRMPCWTHSRLCAA